MGVHVHVHAHVHVHVHASEENGDISRWWVYGIAKLLMKSASNQTWISLEIVSEEQECLWGKCCNITMMGFNRIGLSHFRDANWVNFIEWMKYEFCDVPLDHFDYEDAIFGESSKESYFAVLYATFMYVFF